MMESLKGEKTEVLMKRNKYCIVEAIVEVFVATLLGRPRMPKRL